MMDATNYSDFRKNLKKYMDQVNEDSIELVVTSQNNNNVVVMSKENYDSIIESDYLLSNQVNREILEDSLFDFEHGDFLEEEW